jgi:hypothetical protein
MSDDLKEYKPVKIRVVHKGNVKINHAFVYKESPDIVLILVDMKEKWAKTQGSSNTSTSKHTFIVSKNEDDSGEDWKEFYFPEYNDWKHFSSHISRYTMFITLTKGDD